MFLRAAFIVMTFLGSESSVSSKVIVTPYESQETQQGSEAIVITAQISQSGAQEPIFALTYTSIDRENVVTSDTAKKSRVLKNVDLASLENILAVDRKSLGKFSNDDIKLLTLLDRGCFEIGTECTYYEMHTLVNERLIQAALRSDSGGDLILKVPLKILREWGETIKFARGE